jgi:hypothetical protein
MVNLFYVYVYRDPKNGEPFYVGKGHGDRYKATAGRSKWFKNKVAKMKREGTPPLIEFLVKDCDEELALLCEVEAIDKYGRKDLGTGMLLNLTDGGDGVSGYKPSADDKRKQKEGLAKANARPEVREKRKTASLLALSTDEYKTKASKVQKKSQNNPATVQKRSSSLLAFNATEEGKTIRKLAAAKTWAKRRAQWT